MNTITIGEGITPIAILGQYEKEEIAYPAAQILNHEQNIAFDAVFVASSLIALYEAFLNHVPESQQIKFEEQFKYYINRMFDDKEQYITKFNDNNN
jgi:hypothetical protein